MLHVYMDMLTGGLPDESWGWCEKGCWSGPTRLPTNVPTGLPSHNVTAIPSSAPSVAKPAAEPAEAAPVEAVQPDKPRSADCARQTVQGGAAVALVLKIWLLVAGWD